MHAKFEVNSFCGWYFRQRVSHDVNDILNDINKIPFSVGSNRSFCTMRSKETPPVFLQTGLQDTTPFRVCGLI